MLLYSIRLFFGPAVHTTPNDFLFIPVVASNNDCQWRMDIGWPRICKSSHSEIRGSAKQGTSPEAGYQGITASKTVTVLAEAALYFQNIVVSQSCCCGRNIQQNDSTLSPPCNVPHPFAWPLRPSLIARAAKKVHLHGIVLVGPGWREFSVWQ
jgi:hypothetical protein